jgi:hypothetical protein
MPTFREHMVEDLHHLSRRTNEIRDRVEDIQGHDPSNAELRLLRDYQARADDVYRDLGLVGAPPPLPAESPRSYRVRLARKLQHHSPDWKESDLSNLARVSRNAFAVAEEAIYADAHKVALDPTVTFSRTGELRERKVKDESGRETTVYHGSPLWWMSQFMFPARAVAAFYNSRGEKILPNISTLTNTRR